MPSGGRRLETARGRVRSSLPSCKGVHRRGWHRTMLLSSFTRPAQSTGPESNMELSQSCPIEDERSDCGMGHVATIFPKSRPTQSRMRSRRRSHPRINRSRPNTMNEDVGQVVIDINANASEETKDARCRKTDDDQPAQDKSERRDLEGDGRTNSYHKKD